MYIFPVLVLSVEYSTTAPSSMNKSLVFPKNPFVEESGCEVLPFVSSSKSKSIALSLKENKSVGCLNNMISPSTSIIVVI